MRRKEKALSIGVGATLLGSMVSSTAIPELKILPEQEVEMAEAQRSDSRVLQHLIAELGVVLRVDALRIMLGPAISADDIDVVTAPSMKYR